LAAVLAAGCAVWTLGTAPAAALNPLSLSVGPTELTLPLGPAGGANPAKPVTIWLTHHNQRGPARGRLSVDTAGLAGVAEVTWPAACAPAADGTGAQCDVTFLPRGENNKIVLSVRAAHGAPDGATGTIAFTGRAVGLADVRGTTGVTVAAQPDIFLHGVPRTTNVKPGDTAALPFALTNLGGVQDTGSILRINPSHGLDAVGRHSNCEYEEAGTADHPHASWIICVLDPVAAGGTAAYAQGLPFLAAPDGLIEDADFGLEPYSRAALDAQREGHTMTPGTGPALAPEGAGGPDGPDGGDTWADAKINVDNVAEFSLSAPGLKGAKGAVVSAGVTLTNHGPAWYADSWNERPAAEVDFRPPPGTTVVGAYEDCLGFDKNGRPLDFGVPGVLYKCTEPFHFRAGQSATKVFELRIDKVIRNATGTGFIPSDYVMPYDRDSANNSVKVVLNASAGGGAGTGSGNGGSSSGSSGSAIGGTGTATGGAGAGGDAGGGTGGTSGSPTGGDLAATGGDPVALIGAVALGCGLAGGSVLLLVRSRNRRSAG
jgi:hypothetical protein